MIKDYLMQYFDYSEDEITETEETVTIKDENGNIVLNVEHIDDIELDNYIYTNTDYSKFLMPLKVLSYDFKRYEIYNDVIDEIPINTIILNEYGEIYICLDGVNFFKMVVHAL